MLPFVVVVAFVVVVVAFVVVAPVHENMGGWTDDWGREKEEKHIPDSSDVNDNPG